MPSSPADAATEPIMSRLDKLERAVGGVHMPGATVAQGLDTLETTMVGSPCLAAAPILTRILQLELVFGV
jgi:hypothetical protein